jgi:hypothetical protein
MNTCERHAVAPSAPPNSEPISAKRIRSPLDEVVDTLRELSLRELADVFRFARRIRATRGDRPSPEFITSVMSVVLRLHSVFPAGIPVPVVRANFPRVPRALVEQALLEAERRHLLRLETVRLPAPFVEVGAGIPHERGLLYWIFSSDS